MQTHMQTVIEKAVKKEGIDLIGFAGRERFEGLDLRKNPFTVFPEGKTVIMIGKRICRGALRGVEEGTNFSDYKLFGLNWLEDEFLSLACYNLVSAIEDEGWEAVPLFPNPTDIAPTGISVTEGRAEPNVFPDFDYATVACGLGEIGMNGLFLSPEFGSRQRFHMIITDLELPSSPLCNKRVCNYCGKCADGCPMGAINMEAAEEINICDKVMKVAKIDYNVCKTCKNGACINRLEASAKPDRVAALCNRTCLQHLEENKMVGGVFENTFRKREAWSVGTDQVVRDTQSHNVLGGSFSGKK